MESKAHPSELTDDEWVDAVVMAMRALDPQLQPELALDAARELAARERWRAMSPSDAATKAFG